MPRGLFIGEGERRGPDEKKEKKAGTFQHDKRKERNHLRRLPRRKKRGPKWEVEKREEGGGPPHNNSPKVERTSGPQARRPAISFGGQRD